MNNLNEVQENEINKQLFLFLKNKGIGEYKEYGLYEAEDGFKVYHKDGYCIDVYEDEEDGEFATYSEWDASKEITSQEMLIILMNIEVSNYAVDDSVRLEAERRVKDKDYYHTIKYLKNNTGLGLVKSVEYLEKLVTACGLYIHKYDTDDSGRGMLIETHPQITKND